MHINHHNYQEWALDYIEGNLPPQLRKAFQNFLEGNPLIAGEIRALANDMPVLIPEPVVYPHKAELLRIKGPTPLRRVISLLSGAAAALLLIGVFMVIDKPSSPLTADHVPTTDPVEMTETILPESQILTAHIALPITTMPDTNFSQPKSTSLTNRGINTENQIVNTDNYFNFAEIPGSDTESGNSIRPETIRFGEPILAQLTHKPRLVKMTVPDEVTLVYPTDVPETEMENEPFGFQNGDPNPGLILVQQSLGTLLGPLEQISPIKPYRTEQGKGVEIASIFRIGVRNN